MKSDEVLLPVDGIVVHESVGEQVERRLHLVGEVLPARRHPLAQHRIVDPVPVVNQSRVSLEETAQEVDREVYVGVTVVHGTAEGRPLDLLDEVAPAVQHGHGAAGLVRPDVEPVVGHLHGHQQVLLVIEEVLDTAGLGVVDVGHLVPHLRVGVDVLDGLASVILHPDQSLLLVVEEPHDELAWLEGPDHLTEEVVGEPLLPAADDEAPLVVGDELQVSELDQPVSAVVAQGLPLALFRHCHNVPVDVVSVDPMRLGGLDNVDLIICVVSNLLIGSLARHHH